MSWIGQSRTVIGFLLALALLVTGCTVATGTIPVANSHFAYPNSNVIPLGEGKGEATEASFFYLGGFMDPALMEEAVQAAIKTKGGDLLIDYDLYFRLIYIPFIFPIYVTTWGAEGTVAKMEIGKQKLQ